jgi:hypothetical protein
LATGGGDEEIGGGGLLSGGGVSGGGAAERRCKIDEKKPQSKLKHHAGRYEGKPVDNCQSSFRVSCPGNRGTASKNGLEVDRKGTNTMTEDSTTRSRY